MRINRRRFLHTAAAFAVTAPFRPIAVSAQGRPLRYADMHTHFGVYGRPAALREAMQTNGMLVIARKIVGDSGVTRRIPGKGFEQYREAASGELSGRYETTLRRMKVQHENESLAEIVSAEELTRTVRTGEPAVVLAVEGGDFLEGDLSRLEAARRQGIVHLQLVHYRASSEIGDISTERPVRNGLTPFGREVVMTCNRLGILVDVAHGTSDVIDQVIELSTKPVIYSHGHVAAGAPYFTQGGLRARAIHKPLAQKIAKKGGVIGIWPIAATFRSLDAYAAALIDTAEYLGPAHVAVGSDMAGLPGGSVIPGYEQFPELDGLLAKRGISADDIADILGRNYLRVLGQALVV